MSSAARVALSLLIALPFFQACETTSPASTPASSAAVGNAFWPRDELNPDGTSSIRPYCKTKAVRELSLDSSAGKLSGRELLEQVVGSHRIMLLGHRSDFPRIARVQPESDGVLARLEILASGLSFRHVHRESVKCEPGLPCHAGLPDICWDHFEADVQVSLRSDDGALQERWNAEVHFPDLEDERRLASPVGDKIWLVHDVLPSELQGSMSFPSYEVPGQSLLTAHQLRLNLFFDAQRNPVGGLMSVMRLKNPGDNSPGQSWYQNEELYTFRLQP